jgi:hypothetical protein
MHDHPLMSLRWRIARLTETAAVWRPDVVDDGGADTCENLSSIAMRWRVFVKDSTSVARSIRPGRGGYTARDVAVAVTALGFLLLLVFPFIIARRTESRRITCEMRLRRLGEAIDIYHDQNRSYPGYRQALSGADVNEGQPIGWAFGVLPYLISIDAKGVAPQSIAEQYGPAGQPATRGQRPDDVYLPNLVCPDDPRLGQGPPRPALGSYIGNTGLPDVPAGAQGPADWPGNGVLFDRFGRSPYPVTWPTRDFVRDHDGLEYTLLFSENVDARLWTDADEPRVGFVWLPTLIDGMPAPSDDLLAINARRGAGDGNYRFARPSSMHAGGAYALFCSGKLQFLHENIDYSAFTGLMTSNATDVRRPGSEEKLPVPFLVE